jgi:hypothetical protein
MSYVRVIPRDLFNESKLLKCWGQLSLLIHEGRGIRWPLRVENENTEERGFVIDLDHGYGGLFVHNLSLWMGERPFYLYVPINSREPYPLLLVDEDTDEEHTVFNEDGSLSNEIQAFFDKPVTDTP